MARRAGSLIERAMLALARDSMRPSWFGRLVKALTWSSRIPHSSPRRAARVKGSWRWSQRSTVVMDRSVRGMTHGGVRWKRVRRSTSGAMAGTIWMAEAPVPIMATRWPRRS